MSPVFHPSSVVRGKSPTSKPVDLGESYLGFRVSPSLDPASVIRDQSKDRVRATDNPWSAFFAGRSIDDRGYFVLALAFAHEGRLGGSVVCAMEQGVFDGEKMCVMADERVPTSDDEIRQLQKG
ncbi:MAG: hypothetical protein ACK56F_28655, partial [bacterium]